MTRTWVLLRAVLLTVLYLTAAAGATVLVEPLGNFVAAFVLLSAAYFVVGSGLTIRPGGKS